MIMMIIIIIRTASPAHAPLSRHASRPRDLRAHARQFGRVLMCVYATSLYLKRPTPVASGWVVSGYLSFPLRKHCGNADKQQFKHMFEC